MLAGTVKKIFSEGRKIELLKYFSSVQ